MEGLSWTYFPLWWPSCLSRPTSLEAIFHSEIGTGTSFSKEDKYWPKLMKYYFFSFLLKCLSSFASQCGETQRALWRRKQTAHLWMALHISRAREPPQGTPNQSEFFFSRKAELSCHNQREAFNLRVHQSSFPIAWPNLPLLCPLKALFKRYPLSLSLYCACCCFFVVVVVGCFL